MQLVHEARGVCHQWGSKKIHFLHVTCERKMLADYLSKMVFNRREHVTLMELGVSPPLNESAPRLVKPTKGHGKRKTEFKLGKKVGEGAISGIDMSDTSWHLRGQCPDHQCA